MRVAAPAKVNLVLRILDRRPDGFHELDTLFERIDLADELTFAPREQGIELTCDDPSLDCGPSNLVMKAAKALLEAASARGGTVSGAADGGASRAGAGRLRGAAITLAKRTPVAAGLGGGSSDAASTLIGLNRLWDLRLPAARLAEIGAALGSDVPFFVHEAAFAVGRGRGERCEPADAQIAGGSSGRVPRLHHVLVVPPERLSTRDVYEDFARERAAAAAATGAGTIGAARVGAGEGPKPPLTASGSSISMSLHALRNGSLSELARHITNDLQPVAIRRCPVIQVILTQLRASGAIGACVSGSGSAVFGLYPSANEATAAVDALRQSGQPEWLVRTVSTWDGPIVVS